MRCIQLAILAAFVAFENYLSADESSANTVKISDISSAWKQRSDAFKTLEAVYTKEHLIAANTRIGADIEKGFVFPKEDLTLTCRLRFVLDDERFRLEQSGEQWDNRIESVAHLNRIITFDGEHYRTLLAGSENTDKAYNLGYILDSELHRTKQSAVRNPDVLPLIHAVRPGHQRFPTELHQSWTALPHREIVGGTMCYVLKAQVGEVEYCVWLNDLFQLLRSVTSISNHIVFQTDVKYGGPSDHAHIPIQWETSQYSPNSDRMEQSFVVTLLSVTVNESIAPDEFTVAFPEGTFVKDHPDTDRSQRYIIKNGKHRIITPNELAGSPTYSQLANSDTTQPRLGSVAGVRAPIIVAINVFILLALTLFAFLRRRDSNASR